MSSTESTPIYVADPDYSGPPIRFENREDADRYLAAHPNAGEVPVSAVAKAHR